jgi:hypothetical protein
MPLDMTKFSSTREGPTRDPGPQPRPSTLGALIARLPESHSNQAPATTGGADLTRALADLMASAVPQNTSLRGGHPEDETSNWTKLPIRRRQARAPIVSRFRNEDAALHTRSSLIESRARKELALAAASETLSDEMVYDSTPEQTPAPPDFFTPDPDGSQPHSPILVPDKVPEVPTTNRFGILDSDRPAQDSMSIQASSVGTSPSSSDDEVISAGSHKSPYHGTRIKKRRRKFQGGRNGPLIPSPGAPGISPRASEASPAAGVKPQKSTATAFGSGSGSSADPGASTSAGPKTPPPSTKEDAPTRKSPPPILIYGLKDYAGIMALLVKATRGSYQLSTSKDAFRIRCKEVSTYNEIHSYFKQNDLLFYTYPSEEQRQAKLVLRGLNATIPIEEIERDLVAQGVKVMGVRQLLHRDGGLDDGSPEVEGWSRRMPLFVVTVPHHEPGTPIHLVTEVCHHRVSVEKYRGVSGPRQCFNCQFFGHSSVFCHLPPVCFKCAGNHPSAQCRKPANVPATCSNCKGDHTASYRGCPAFHEAADAIKNPAKSRHRGNPQRRQPQPFSARAQTSRPNKRPAPVRSAAAATSVHASSSSTPVGPVDPSSLQEYPPLSYSQAAQPKSRASSRTQRRNRNRDRSQSRSRSRSQSRSVSRSHSRRRKSPAPRSSDSSGFRHNLASPTIPATQAYTPSVSFAAYSPPGASQGHPPQYPPAVLTAVRQIFETLDTLVTDPLVRTLLQVLKSFLPSAPNHG